MQTHAMLLPYPHPFQFPQCGRYAHAQKMLPTVMDTLSDDAFQGSDLMHDVLRVAAAVITRMYTYFRPGDESSKSVPVGRFIHRDCVVPTSALSAQHEEVNAVRGL